MQVHVSSRLDARSVFVGKAFAELTVTEVLRFLSLLPKGVGISTTDNFVNLE